MMRAGDVNHAADSDVLTIAQLVTMRLAQGYSLRDLEEASGGVVGRGQFQNISQGEVATWPKNRETVEGVARALGIDARQVVHGYARQLGIDIHENRSLLASMLPSEAQNLAPRQAQAVADLIRAFAPTHPVEQAEPVTLDITEFQPENKRTLNALAGDFKQRAEQAAEHGNTDMAATFDALAEYLEAAMRAATD